MSTVIVIPARFGSVRFLGKPLALIAGQTMLSRVYDIGQQAIEGVHPASLVVATDDARIAEHCDAIGARWVMTPVDCPTGTDRALAAVQALGVTPDHVINLQGDAPLTPPDFIRAMIEAFIKEPSLDCVTPVTQLTWKQLDKLRESKKTTPFSGTTAVIDSHDNALWFSKSILPAMRKEEKLRETTHLSPVFRHIGLYGFRYEILKKFVAWPESYYEGLEGLEQLRVLENGYKIRCVKVDYNGRPSMSGIDSPEDIARAEKLLADYHAGTKGGQAKE